MHPGGSVVCHLGGCGVPRECRSRKGERRRVRPGTCPPVAVVPADVACYFSSLCCEHVAVVLPLNLVGICRWGLGKEIGGDGFF